MSSKVIVLVTACLLLAAATCLQAVTLTVSPDADTYVSGDTPNGNAAFLYMHDTQDAVVYVRFDLAALNVLSVQDATLTMTVSGGAPRNDNLIADRFWLHGLDNVPGNTPQDWDEATLSAANVGAEYGDPLVNVTDLNGTVAGVTETVTNVAGLDYWVAGSRIATVTGETFVAFLQSRVDDNGLVTLLVDFPGSTGRGLAFASKEFETVEFRPTLVLEATIGARTAAVAPSPEDGATDVSRDVVLGWEPGQLAATHNVYFSTSFQDVNGASPDALVTEGLSSPSYDPEGSLAYGQTYYWRVDEVNSAPDFTVYDGIVWSFTVEPVAYPVTNVTASASIPSDGDKVPENTVNGSGLNEQGQHGTSDTDMWQGNAAAGDPVWVQFDFDQVYKLHEMRIWNYNMDYEFILGFGVKDVTIEYATEPNEWTVLGDYQIAQGTNMPDYTGMTLDLEGIAAKSIRMNINSNWITPNRYGISEVAFSYIPVLPRDPMPVPGATQVDPAVVLSWHAGREAASHQVYFGTDPNAVADDTALLDTTDVSMYDLGTVDLGTTYYWKVTEVNEAEVPSAWTSEVWSFSTPDFIVVDGFETYTDNEGSLVYEAWADGFNIPGNGSQVGHDNPPYAEQDIVRSGNQAMPFYYGKEGATTSEATLTVGGQDWTQAGAQTLVLYFRGDLGNAPGQVYLKVNSTRRDYPGGAASLAAPSWKQWNIDLASLGNAARNITSLTIGVSGSGEGLMYVDDIRLYKEAPAMPEAPADPGAANLVALYTMEGSVADGSGNGRNGTAQTGASFGQGPTGYGQALVLDGTSGYATLPIGPLVQASDSMTVAAWVSRAAGGQNQRVFDFGNDTDVYMFMAPSSGGGVRFALTTQSYTSESQVVSENALPSDGSWHHVAITIDSATSELNLYVDGVLADTSTTETLPSDLGNTANNWIGRSQWEADPYLTGAIDDFRIYDRALSEGEVRYLVGDR
ncbi:MAG: discoidin domain-containing protein [Sedimentisphaerales bacterium]|nr:discoidin domain-containing protein [Sedimentisphaerales bacterium]